MKEGEDVHSIFTKDPREYKSMVDNIVEVETDVDNSVIKGVLYTVDPVSGCVIILNNAEGSVKMEIVMAHDVKSIKVVQKSDVPGIPKNLFKEDWAKYASEEELDKMRHKLKEWLVKNTIPIVESGKLLKLAEVLTIEPPYGVEQCMSSNENVLSKIQDLIKVMPK